MVKQNLCWTGHFIPPPPTENASNTLSFERGPWGERGPGRARAPKWLLCLGRGYKVASPGKTPEKTEPMKKQNLCWTGHFIEKKISLERGPQGEWGPGQLFKVTWMMYLMTL